MIAQGEDIESPSEYDVAYLVVADYPEEAAIPAGDDLYDVIAGPSESWPPA